MDATLDTSLAFLDFYSADYLERRGEAKYAGQYRKVTALQSARGEAAADRLWRGARDTVEAARFGRFLTPDGPASSDPAGRDLEYALVRVLTTSRAAGTGRTCATSRNRRPTPMSG